ncbi:MAG: hypothetical protein WAM42_09535, partial [Candidatus Nitrosopolaris sp.]
NDSVIKFYSAVLDHEKLGYDLTAIIEVISVKGKIAEVEKHIAKFPNVCAVYDITEFLLGIIPDTRDMLLAVVNSQSLVGIKNSIIEA